MKMLLAISFCVLSQWAWSQNTNEGPVTNDGNMKQGRALPKDEGPVPMQRQTEDLSERGPSGKEALKAVEEIQPPSEKEKYRKQRGE